MITLEATWRDTVRSVDTTDQVLGGDDDAPLNGGIKDLGDRTEWMKQYAPLDPIVLNGVGSTPVVAHEFAFPSGVDRTVLFEYDILALMTYGSSAGSSCLARARWETIVSGITDYRALVVVEQTYDAGAIVVAASIDGSGGGRTARLSVSYAGTGGDRRFVVSPRLRVDVADATP